MSVAARRCCAACSPGCTGAPGSCRCHWYSDPIYGQNRIEDQPPPVPNAARPVWELVIDDMQARDHVGRERYGTPLQAGNGRDALVDAYQEALDLCVYLRQAIEERSGQ